MSPPLHPDERYTSAPGVSPGIVENKEVLLREMYSPYHIKDGEVTPRAMTLKELKSITSGASVHRKKYTSRTSLEKAIQDKILFKKQQGKFWTSEGSAVFTARQVREILRQNTGKETVQAFIVKDTASLERPDHASIHFADFRQFILTIDPDEIDEYLREWRLDLLVLLEKRMSPEEVFR